MRRFPQAILPILVGFLLISSCGFGALLEPGDWETGEKGRVLLGDLHPTQAWVGFLAVDYQVRRFERAREKGKKRLKRLKKKKRVEVVIGPGGSHSAKRLYLIDGHHWARALDELGEEEIHAVIVDDLSHLKWGLFWKQMRARNWAYLYSINNNPITPDRLPENVGGLRDDPFRSLSWLVRKAGGYTRLLVPYQEFPWAHYFRGRMPSAEFTTAEQWMISLTRAMGLAKSEEASGLAGWHGQTVTCGGWLGILSDIVETDN